MTRLARPPTSGLPEEGTDGHATLLPAEFLAARLRSGDAGPVAVQVLVAHMAGLAQVHRAHWRKGVTEPGADRALTDQAIRRLTALGLARETADGVAPQPAWRGSDVDSRGWVT